MIASILLLLTGLAKHEDKLMTCSIHKQLAIGTLNSVKVGKSDNIDVMTEIVTIQT